MIRNDEFKENTEFMSLANTLFFQISSLAIKTL